MNQQPVIRLPACLRNKDLAQVTDDEIGMMTVKHLGRRVADGCFTPAANSAEKPRGGQA